MIETVITVTKEMKEALQYALSDMRSPKIMCNYLIEKFQDEAYLRGSWECLYTSKNYKDLIKNYKAIEWRFGCDDEFTIELTNFSDSRHQKIGGFEEWDLD